MTLTLLKGAPTTFNICVHPHRSKVSGGLGFEFFVMYLSVTIFANQYTFIKFFFNPAPCNSMSFAVLETAVLPLDEELIN